MNPALVIAALEGAVELIDHISERLSQQGQLSPEYVAKRQALSDALDALADSLDKPGGTIPTLP